MIFPGTAAWRRFWRGQQWSERLVRHLARKGVDPFHINRLSSLQRESNQAVSATLEKTKRTP